MNKRIYKKKHPNSMFKFIRITRNVEFRTESPYKDFRLWLKENMIKKHSRVEIRRNK